MLTFVAHDPSAQCLGACFVARKDGSLRRTFDTRTATCCFADALSTRPPITSAFSDLEGEGDRRWVAAGDTINAFYQLRMPPGLEHYFRPPPIGSSCHRAAGVPVLPDGAVQGCIAVMPMGSSWLLHLCPRVLRAAIDRAWVPSSVPIEGGRPAVSLSQPTDFGCAGHVDNCLAVGTYATYVDAVVGRVSKLLQGVGIHVHDAERAAGDCTFLGLELRAGRRLSVKGRNCWRARYAIEEVLRRKKVSGHPTRTLLGHITWTPLRELWRARRFLPLLKCDLSAPWSSNVTGLGAGEIGLGGRLGSDASACGGAMSLATSLVGSSAPGGALSFLALAAVRPAMQAGHLALLRGFLAFCPAFRLGWSSTAGPDGATAACWNHVLLNAGPPRKGAPFSAAPARFTPGLLGARRLMPGEPNRRGASMHFDLGPPVRPVSAALTALTVATQSLWALAVMPGWAVSSRRPDLRAQGPLSPTPHSLRHWGASHDTQALQRPLEGTQRHGQWAAPPSMKRYATETHLLAKLAQVLHWALHLETVVEEHSARALEHSFNAEPLQTVAGPAAARRVPARLAASAVPRLRQRALPPRRAWSAVSAAFLELFADSGRAPAELRALGHGCAALDLANGAGGIHLGRRFVLMAAGRLNAGIITGFFLGTPRTTWSGVSRASPAGHLFQFGARWRKATHTAGWHVAGLDALQRALWSRRLLL
ncbi:unnamed protein product [Prorocentrum cordatum]|uniref:Uncharacterized protein n=1 Tax=Prorocentrum cordatum TaxID=2364126 RepID=A0ABN9XM43_9DINO|nr:unnamed protein product [Polarella glacialis]